jgi:hypothetical protein
MEASLEVRKAAEDSPPSWRSTLATTAMAVGLEDIEAVEVTTLESSHSTAKTMAG